MADASAPAAKRQAVIAALMEQRDPQTRAAAASSYWLDEGLRGAALRALAAYDDPKTPEVILSHYAKFSEADKRDAILTLSSRPDYALAMFDAMEQGKLPRSDVSAFVARQLAGHEGSARAA